MKKLIIIVLFLSHIQAYCNENSIKETQKNDTIISEKILGLKNGLKINISSGYSFGISKISVNRFKLRTLIGYQMTPNLSIGLGTGFNFKSKYNGLEPYINSDNTLSTPIFINISTFLKKNVLIPYFSLDFGGNFRFKEQWVKSIGYLANPEIGFIIRINDNILLNMGIVYEIETNYIRYDPKIYYEFYDIFPSWGDNNMELNKNIQSLRFNIGITYN